MNRRNFILKIFGAAAAAVCAPIAKLFKREPGSDVSYSATMKELGAEAGAQFEAVPAGEGFADDVVDPYRRVLVMASFWRTDPRVNNSSNMLTYGTVLSDAVQVEPRWAQSWTPIRFEDLKKGDHFRLIDVPQVDDPKKNEDGKTVYVALTDAHFYGPHLVVSVNQAYDYPGRGAGFDWYDVHWPSGTHAERIAQLQRLQGLA